MGGGFYGRYHEPRLLKLVWCLTARGTVDPENVSVRILIYNASDPGTPGLSESTPHYAQLEIAKFLINGWEETPSGTRCGGSVVYPNSGRTDKLGGSPPRIQRGTGI